MPQAQNPNHTADRMGLLSQELPIAVKAAIDQISNHPSINDIVTAPSKDKHGNWTIEINMDVPLPRDARDKGISTTGVKATEWVRIEFPASFPSHAPRLFLRADFNRAHPHINPGRPGELVSPCIYEGRLDDLLHEPDWINGIINQLADWLSKAATGELLDCSGQGWEPIRRDSVDGTIVTNISIIRERMANAKNPISQYLRYEYWQSIVGHSGRIIDENTLYANIGEAIRKFRIGNNERSPFRSIFSLAMVISGGTKKTIDVYQPDDVESLEQLLLRAESYGCRSGLENRLKEITENITLPLIEQKLDFAVLFAVKRPCNLIGEDIDIEIIPYGITFTSDQNRRLQLTRTSVFPLVLIQKVSQQLLAETSDRNLNEADRRKEIAMIGCGSLGSKIALHLARSGHGPFRLYDKDCFSPHNTARHAVANSAAAEFMLPKVWLTEDLLKQVGANVTQVNNSLEDVISILQTKPDLFAKCNGLIIDATASSSVQDALCMVRQKHFGAPLLQVALYGRGKIGFFGLEGKDRNPRVDDMVAQLYQLGLDSSPIGAVLYQATNFDRINTGQGCASFSMKMSDAKISLFSAGISERASQLLDNGIPKDGEFLVGLLTEDGLGVNWLRQPTTKIEVLHIGDKSKWELRIPAALKDQMRMETEQRRPLETGGVLIGHINWGRRTIYVTGLLPPPTDSEFRTDEFVLGIQGLKKQISVIEKTTSHTLTYLGTWHSHPNGGAASGKDRSTLAELTRERGNVPSVCLIYRPHGLLAVPGPVTNP
ncbi:MAG: Mov34/MPN/PAD-1 family protein [Methylicorpusculum sp.]|uniref:Mov34/MPN/PAD-1 family protein n=1 Tax=Methylicorpusculum TaxID=2713642 RepID=UPI001359F06D|nr:MULTISPECIES: Mov34/MPN/PAD-1 family protein [Methylicorpusculum]MCD2452009.1 Mov34/MPN/PAD-1 family protein [Methylicorpusculum oleiharenae]MDP2203527.1 Mov34/MPN/PAD-1 family protein [Methylicorpusculum sp.]